MGYTPTIKNVFNAEVLRVNTTGNWGVDNICVGPQILLVVVTASSMNGFEHINMLRIMSFSPRRGRRDCY